MSSFSWSPYSLKAFAVASPASLGLIQSIDQFALELFLSKFPCRIRVLSHELCRVDHSTCFHILKTSTHAPYSLHYLWNCLVLQNPRMWIQKDSHLPTSKYPPHPCHCLQSICRTSFGFSFLPAHIGWWPQRWPTPNWHFPTCSKSERCPRSRSEFSTWSSGFHESPNPLCRMWRILRAL